STSSGSRWRWPVGWCSPAPSTSSSSSWSCSDSSTGRSGRSRRSRHRTARPPRSAATRTTEPPSADPGPVRNMRPLMPRVVRMHYAHRVKTFDSLYAELQQKYLDRPQGSKTVAELDAGVHAIGKKVVEEAAEVWM